MEVDLQMYLIVLPMVFLAATVDSISGGGGLISLPSYTLAGLDYNLAAGTNKFTAMFGSLSATIRYFRSGKLMLLPSLCACIPALPGSYIGTQLAIRLGSEVMTRVMLAMLPLVALAVLLRGRKEVKPKPMNRARLLLCGVTGLVCGMYDGFFGPGTGTFLIIMFTWLCGMDMVTASGTSKPVNLMSNIASLIAWITQGHVLFPLALPAVLFSIAGGYIGAFLAVRRGARLVRYVMIGVLALLMISLIPDVL